jgi:hypothetical protein
VLPQICRKHRMDGRRARVYERWLKRATAKQVPDSKARGRSSRGGSHSELEE